MATVKPYHYDKYGRLGILAIDDDQVNLMVMESLLRPLGFVVSVIWGGGVGARGQLQAALGRISVPPLGNAPDGDLRVRGWTCAYASPCIVGWSSRTALCNLAATPLCPVHVQVVSAQDGSEAYAAVNDEDTWPDIVFLDYNLEFGDSGETVRGHGLNRGSLLMIGWKSGRRGGTCMPATLPRRPAPAWLVRPLGNAGAGEAATDLRVGGGAHPHVHGNVGGLHCAGHVHADGRIGHHAQAL